MKIKTNNHKISSIVLLYLLSALFISNGLTVNANNVVNTNINNTRIEENIEKRKKKEDKINYINYKEVLLDKNISLQEKKELIKKEIRKKKRYHKLLIENYKEDMGNENYLNLISKNGIELSELYNKKEELK